MQTIPGTITQSERTDDYIFTEEDIYTTTNSLTRLFRKIFVEKKITYTLLKEKHRKYMHALGASLSSTNYHWANHRNAIVKETITFHMFTVVISAILELQITNIAFTVVDSDTNGQTVYDIDL